MIAWRACGEPPTSSGQRGDIHRGPYHRVLSCGNAIKSSTGLHPADLHQHH